MIRASNYIERPASRRRCPNGFAASVAASIGSLALVVGCVGCDQAPPRRRQMPTGALQITEKLRLGLAGTAADPGEAGGPLLGGITDIRVGPGGYVYVLDPTFKKIAIFEKSGELSRTVLGGMGQGPGEFLQPIALAVSEAGELVTFDYQLNRLSFFDAAGNHIADRVDVPRTRSLFFGKKHVYGSYYPGREFRIWQLNREAAYSDLVPLIEIEPEDTEFYQDGDIARLAVTRKDSMIVSSIHPGRWLEVELERGGQDFVWRGSGSFSGERYFPVPGADKPLPPAATMGVGLLAPGYVGVAYRHYVLEADGAGSDGRPRLHVGKYLDVYTESGRYVGTAAISTDWLGAFATSPGENRIYYTTTEPYMQVVGAEVVIDDPWRRRQERAKQAGPGSSGGADERGGARR